MMLVMRRTRMVAVIAYHLSRRHRRRRGLDVVLRRLHGPWVIPRLWGSLIRISIFVL